MQTRIYRWCVSILLMSSLILGGCATSAQQSDTLDDSIAETQAQSPVPSESNQFSGLPYLEGEATVEMIVNGAPISILVRGLDAPITAGNFVDLANRGVYDGLVFHRVIRQPQPFVVQGGDPQGKDPNFPANQLGTGSFVDPATGQPRYIPLEITPANAQEPVYSQTLESAGITDQPPKLRHTRGAVAMARSNLPDSASAQFYFALADLEFLDGDYAVFGYVTEGMDVVDQIQQGDRITSARVTSGLNNLKLMD
ncbi:peptidylprolyl isomerase [Egbenema bharatensis]|uniref:peptidylprolyl isomerase n=1 Tax=Egbenema bharatensis TaxID=3463334 RepID=UPI003A8A62C2